MAQKHELGKAGEKHAERFLKGIGYEIVETNVRTAAGELDIVARHEGATVFIEVKTRSGEDFGTGLEAVDAAKRRKITQSAQLYLQKHPAGKVRFDVVWVKAARGRDWEFDLVQDAFSAEE